MSFFFHTFPQIQMFQDSVDDFDPLNPTLFSDEDPPQNEYDECEMDPSIDQTVGATCSEKTEPTNDDLFKQAFGDFVVAGKCTHCLTRMEELWSSSSSQCKDASVLLAHNWTLSGRSCCGICRCECVCVKHGYPMDVCQKNFPGIGHKFVIRRGKWVSVKSEEAEKYIQGSFFGTPISEIANTVVVASSDDCCDCFESPAKKRTREERDRQCDNNDSLEKIINSTSDDCSTHCECYGRLKKLLSMTWVASDSVFVGLLVKRAEESKSKCIGICKASYLCRIHACPAYVSGLKGSSKYQCHEGDHSSSLTTKGRYHESFCFYCDNPDCCGGKWFSRDETHSRSVKRHKKQLDLVLSPKEESVSESHDPTNTLSSPPQTAPNTSSEACSPSAPPMPPQEAQSYPSPVRIPGEAPVHIIPEGSSCPYSYPVQPVDFVPFSPPYPVPTQEPFVPPSPANIHYNCAPHLVYPTVPVIVPPPLHPSPASGRTTKRLNNAPVFLFRPARRFGKLVSLGAAALVFVFVIAATFCFYFNAFPAFGSEKNKQNDPPLPPDPHNNRKRMVFCWQSSASSSTNISSSCFFCNKNGTITECKPPPSGPNITIQAQIKDNNIISFLVKTPDKKKIHLHNLTFPVIFSNNDLTFKRYIPRSHNNQDDLDDDVPSSGLQPDETETSDDGHRNSKQRQEWFGMIDLRLL